MGLLKQSNQAAATLTLSAISPKHCKLVTNELRWKLWQRSELVAESLEGSPTFLLPPGSYELTAHHPSYNTTSLDRIHLPPDSITDLVVHLDGDTTPDEYHIDDEDAFNPESEFQRRELDRKSQRALARHDDVLKKPPTREQLQQQQQALQRSGMGPMAHPILSHMVQFDGAVEPEVNPVPSENPDTVNELVNQLELTMQPEFHPKPQSGPRTFGG